MTTRPTQAPIRWGISSTGKIAQSFARDLACVPDSVLAAVGSRSLESAQHFADEFGDDRTRAYGSTEELAADPGIDVVYVASPHSLHHQHAGLAIDAGKAVLCEKPLTLDSAQARDLIARAADRGVFLMEAMWMACNPVVLRLLDGLEAGRFGQPKQLHADLGFVVEAPETDRMMDPALGAGALMDMGPYPLTLAYLLLGEPEALAATAGFADSGIDLDVAIAGRYPEGAVAALTVSMTSTSPRTATLATTGGLLELPASFHHPAYARFTPTGGQPERIEGTIPLLGKGLGNEAAEVQRCLREGLLESPLVPHRQTMALMTQFDAIRAQLGIVYPGE